MSLLDKKIEFKKIRLPKLRLPEIEGFPTMKFRYIFYGALGLAFVFDWIDFWDMAIIYFAWSIFFDDD